MEHSETVPGSATASEQGDLQDRLLSLKEEVDALQITVMKQSGPWYKEVPTIVSLLALLFSFGTTWVSHNRSNAQDIQNARGELRTLLQRLAALPKDSFELTKKYSDDSVTAGMLSSYVNQENALLARQAAEIAQKLPGDKVSATERYAIAVALQNSYNIEGASTFLQQAIKTANNINDELAALRSYANLLFISGQFDAGRQEYEKALRVFSRYKGYNEYIQKSSHIWTELAWAVSEANSGLLDLAYRHLENADALAASLMPGPATDQLRKQISQSRAMFEVGNKPAPPPFAP